MTNSDQVGLSSSGAWSSYYQTLTKRGNFYPENFVVRIFLSKSPVKFLEDSFIDKSILDLGCGHGRHIPFLQNLGFTTSGLEVSTELVGQLKEVFPSVEFSVGRADTMPYSDGSFDYILACNSIYYLDQEVTEDVADHFSECSRILRAGGKMIFSMLGEKHSLLKQSEVDGLGNVRLSQDFLGFRGGLKLRPFRSGDSYSMFDGFDILKRGEILERVDDDSRHLHYFLAQKS